MINIQYSYHLGQHKGSRLTGFSEIRTNCSGKAREIESGSWEVRGVRGVKVNVICKAVEVILRVH